MHRAWTRSSRGYILSVNQSCILTSMRTQPPENFDTADFCKSFCSFQQWELFPVHVVPGAKDVTSHMRHLRIPERLDGSRVLDIAPWNGFFGFECLRRGAAEVV